MKQLLSITVTALTLTLAATSANACYADYKAKRDNPLKLHYGVIELSGGACDNKKAAASEISSRLSRGGWKLLSVIGIFEDDGLKERKKSAGAYYLRF